MTLSHMRNLLLFFSRKICFIKVLFIINWKLFNALMIKRMDRTILIAVKNEDSLISQIGQVSARN